MQTYIWVFFGAGLGGALRHGVNVASGYWWGAAFPWGTLVVNSLGGLIMGGLAGYFALHGDASQHWRLFLTTGILGGFTTFSAFSLDTVLLWQRGEIGLAALYVGASLLGAVGGLVLGLWAARAF